MSQVNKELYEKLFPITNSSTQIPYEYRGSDMPPSVLQCTAKSNEILLIGHQNYVKLIDLVTKRCSIVEYKDDETVSAVGIGYYNDCMFIGSSRGTLTMHRLRNTQEQYIYGDQYVIKQFSSSVISDIFSTNGDLVIVISMDEIQFYFINDALRISSIENNQQPKRFTIDANRLNIVSHRFPILITACEFNHYSNQLVIGLADHNIFIYTITGDSLDRVIQKAKVLKVEEFGVIKNLSIHNDGKLLAYTQINIFNKNEFKIYVSDLKKYDKTILTHTQKGEGNSVEMTFFPIATRLLVGHDSKYFIIDIDSSNPDNIQRENIQSFQANAPVKNIYPLNIFQDFPNFLYIDEAGKLTTIVFDSPKIDQLQQLPFLYYVEQRLKETLNYKPRMQDLFQKCLLTGFTGVDFEKLKNEPTNDPQTNHLFNSEIYFEPYFSRIGKWKELKEHYETYHRKYLCYQSNRENWPLKQISDWNLQRQGQISSRSNSNDKGETRNLLQNSSYDRQQTSPDIQPSQEQIRKDRYKQLTKLFENINPQGKTAYFLSNCYFLFMNQWQFSTKVLDLTRQSSQYLQYLDLSNNNLKIQYIQQIIEGLNMLQFLDISGNKLGDDLIYPDQFNIYNQLFSKIEIINLRNNNYRNEDGEKLIEIFGKNNKVRVLDLSGNPLFAVGTQKSIEKILDQKLTKPQNTQTLIIEFNPLTSQRSMTQLTNLVINQIRQHSIKAQDMKFYLYVVNSNEKIQWNQSLIEMYEEIEFAPEDEIKSCIYAFLQTFQRCFQRMLVNMRNNCKSCAYSTLCTTLIVKKYVFCCYCIFLQTSIGKFIQDMLGIKTADYEYNETKDRLREYFQANINSLRFLFWINIVIFYFICIFVPFFFVEDIECSGIKWTGHFIYIGYAVFICIAEFILARICINYGVTHDAYEKGTLFQRARNFLKDLVLSQLSKFDVYSDICFISTVLNCGDHDVIGYVSIAVMFVTLSSTFSQLWKQLAIKTKGRDAINYFDFVCNYCSFAEIHLVASLLERWTVQNQNDFLCIEGIPSRVYASIMRSFAEDLPQFLLQLIYINITVESNSLMLNLSLASSIISIIISLTKTLTITKANRINDTIQMREVKQKLQVREGDVDPELKRELVDYLYHFPEMILYL